MIETKVQDEVRTNETLTSPVTTAESSVDSFVEWLRRRGHRVVRTESSYWYDQGPRVYQAFPYHWLIEPPEAELRGFLRQTKALALRYSTPLSASCGKLSYHVVFEGPSFDLASLPRQARQNVRKGMEFARVERISMTELMEEGWRLRSETLARQGRQQAEDLDWWRRVCMCAEDLPGFEAWGAIHEGELVSSMLAFACDDCYTFLLQQSASAHLKHGINNTIFYCITNQVLQRPEIRRVFVCLHSLDAPPDVDEFKFRMGYTPKPVRQRIVVHPLLAPLFNRFSLSLVTRMLGYRPGNPTLAKAEGMIRFYVEGKRALHDQPVPEPLLTSSTWIEHA